MKTKTNLKAGGCRKAGGDA